METMHTLSESLSTEADIMFIQCLKTLQKIEDGNGHGNCNDDKDHHGDGNVDDGDDDHDGVCSENDHALRVCQQRKRVQLVSPGG